MGKTKGFMLRTKAIVLLCCLFNGIGVWGRLFDVRDGYLSCFLSVTPICHTIIDL